MSYHTDPSPRGRGSEGHQRGGRGGGFDNQRGGRGGGFDNQRGGRGGGFDNQRGGRGGGFDNQRGGRGGGFDNQRGGRGGGFDNQRGGRGGGFDNQRGGRGGGFDNGGARVREMNAIKQQKQVANASVDVTTNQVKLGLDGTKRLYLYTISYEFKENATDDRGGAWKEGAVARLLEIIGESSPAYKDVPELAVHTGQQVLSPIQLPEDVTWDYKLKEKLGGKGEITRVYGVSLAASGEKQLSLPSESLWVNLVLSKAALTEYTEKVGDRLVDVHHRHQAHGGVVTMDAVILKAMRVHIKKEPVNVLQVDVAKSVGRDANNTCGRLIAMQRQRRPQDVRRVCDEMFKGRRVMTTYADTVLKVKEIVWDLTAGSPAGVKRDPSMTFCRYFKERYNLDVKPDGVIFMCRHTKGGGRPTPFPADLLQPMFLDEEQTRELPVLCSIFPRERFELVSKTVQRLAQSPSVMKVLRAYGLSIIPGLLTVGGDVVSAPNVYVPSRAGFQKVDLTAEENLGQGGFAPKLSVLCHPTQSALFAKEFLVDPELLRRLGGKLTQYNPPLPQPKPHSFRTPQAVKEDKALHKNSLFAVVKLPDMGKEPYESYKRELGRCGIVSQMVAREPERSIPFAIAQQICAKTGCLNTVVDVGEVAQTLTANGTKDLLIIGVDVGSSANRREVSAHKVVREQNYTVAFVAFHVRGRQWKTYCNHCQVKGGAIVLHTSGTDDDGASSAPTEAARRQNPSEVLEKRFKEFLMDAVSTLKLAGKGGAKAAGTVLLYRGSPSEGEVMRSGVLQQDVREALPTWDYAVLIAQARSHTRFGWRVPGAAGGAVCNAPRGFCTFEAADTFFADDTVKNAKKAARAFSLVGANCTLGHASNTLYVITATSRATLPEKEIVALTYAMCYMYPNKADALPLPLPMKCAAEYARKFACLPTVQSLNAAMRQSMHYL